MKRHVPLRRCVACRSARPKHELIRVVRTPGGCVEVDHTGKAAGRGAYLCRAAECVEIAVRKQALRRALGQALPEQTAECLGPVHDRRQICVKPAAG